MDQTAAQKETEIRADEAASNPSLAKIDMKLEVVIIPVSDFERAKEFYKKLGWRLDITPPGVVQFTPRGSGCSVQFGGNRTSAAPGSAQGLWLIVSDLQTALNKLAGAGIERGTDVRSVGRPVANRESRSERHSCFWYWRSRVICSLWLAWGERQRTRGAARLSNSIPITS